MINISVLKHILFVASMSMVRVVALFAVVPFMSRQLIPGLVRNSIMFCLVLIIYPIVAPTIPPEPGSFLLTAGIIAKEVVIGIIMGFLVGIIFWTAECVGAFIDNQRGATIASSLNPMSGEQASPLGMMIQQVVTVLFFISGGFLTLLSAIFESYKVWPVFSFFPKFHSGFPLFMLQQVDSLMSLTVLLASPVIIIIFATEFSLGLINRFTPQFNVFFLSMPIKSGLASFFMILYFSILMSFFMHHFSDSVQVFKFMRALMS